MEIITAYCEASRQKLNLEKTSMIFSRNVKEEMRKNVAECIGVTVAEIPRTYIGIPSMWGKIKV